MEKALYWANNYVNRGWWVFPCHTTLENGKCSCENVSCNNNGKHPRTKRGYKDGSHDLKMVEEWFGPGAPPSNIAIVTGKVSNLTVLDIDSGEAKVGEESWSTVLADHEEPVTLISQTGGGGRHLLFEYSPALKTSSNILGKNIDCRNDGGYIIVPPSRHRTGGIYEWNNWETPLAVLPTHLAVEKKTRGRPRQESFTYNPSSLEEVIAMLGVIPADERNMWRAVGIILGREFQRSPEAWQAYVKWTDKWQGVKGRDHDKIMHECFYVLSQQQSTNELTLGTLIKEAHDHGWSSTIGKIPVEDFIYYGPKNSYLYRPTNQHWSGTAVDVAVRSIEDGGNSIKASVWLKKHRLVTSLACDPDQKEGYISGVNCVSGHFLEGQGAAIFNTYRKSHVKPGDATCAQPWVSHIYRLMNKPEDAVQFLNYMAHRVQHPGRKPRFALLIAGEVGNGKDTAIDMVVPGIGEWNVANIAPAVVDGNFNEYAASTLVRINEAANLHELNKWTFNERSKVLIAGNPDTCEINPKYGAKYIVRMYCGVIITTNHLLASIFIPPDDRRYDVIACATLEEMGIQDERIRCDYFQKLWAWFYAEEGARHVLAFLREWDLEKFSAALGQRRTAAHQEIVRTGMVVDEWAADAVDLCRNQDMISGSVMCRLAVQAGERLENVKARLGHAMLRLGYQVYANPNSRDGRWKIKGRMHKIFKRPQHPPERGWENNLDSLD